MVHSSTIQAEERVHFIIDDMEVNKIDKETICWYFNDFLQVSGRFGYCFRVFEGARPVNSDRKSGDA